MTSAGVVARAQKALKESLAKYKLGQGGYNPDSPLPEGSTGLCDCSGFTSWCLGVSRKSTNAFLRKLNGGWLETTAMVKDAKTKDGLFTEFVFATPGMLICYGDTNTGQGHVGVITETAEGRVTKIIHCSSGASKRTGRAIAEGGPELAKYFYDRGAIHIRFDGLSD